MAARINPKAYSEAIYNQLLERIANGESLRQIQKTKGFPSAEAVSMRVVRDAAFSERYARCRQAQAVLIAEELLEIADDTSNDVTGELSMPNMAAIMRSRVRLDTRKWYLSKVLPKVYGDKVIHQGDADNPILILADRLSNARKRLRAPKTIEAQDLALPADSDDPS